MIFYFYKISSKKRMEKVLILMSTYNGEKYIKEQLDSIVKQDYEGEITILIRDDGSKDRTVEIIKEYPRSQYREVELLLGQNIGPQKSFLELIRVAGEADYYFFADQDDIWYTEKVRRAIEQLTTESREACYCSNYDIYNMSTNRKFSCMIKNKPPFRPLKILFYNQIPGCVMGFNSKLMSVLKKITIENVMMHDSMTLALASSIGSVIYDCTPSICHRIHGENVIGEGHKKIVLSKWVLEKIKIVINKDDFDLGEVAAKFIDTNKVKDEFINDLVLLRDYKKNIKKTIELLRHSDSKDKLLDRTTVSIRCKILFHVF